MTFFKFNEELATIYTFIEYSVQVCFIDEMQIVYHQFRFVTIANKLCLLFLI